MKTLATLIKSLSLAVALLISCRGYGQADNISTESLRVGNRTRTFQLRLPKGNHEGPRPLLLLLHGRLGTGRGMLGYAAMGKVADRHGVVIVAPDGYRKSWNDGRVATPAYKAGVDDVQFLDRLLDHMVGTNAIDQTRIYCAGMSNGGFMTMTLMHAIGQRFAALAIVTATVPELDAADHLPCCKLPLLIINGTEDPLVPYQGGFIAKRRKDRIIGTEDLARRYSDLLGCTSVITTPLPNTAEDGCDVVAMEWSGSPTGAEVHLIRVNGGGHTWPGRPPYLKERFIGKACQDLDASSHILEFLLRWHKPS